MGSRAKKILNLCSQQTGYQENQRQNDQDTLSKAVAEPTPTLPNCKENDLLLDITDGELLQLVQNIQSEVPDVRTLNLHSLDSEEIENDDIQFHSTVYTDVECEIQSTLVEITTNIEVDHTENIKLFTDVNTADLDNIQLGPEVNKFENPEADNILSSIENIESENSGSKLHHLKKHNISNKENELQELENKRQDNGQGSTVQNNEVDAGKIETFSVKSRKPKTKTETRN